MDTLAAVLAEQRVFYARRAPEWDTWITAYMAPIAAELAELLRDGTFHAADVIELAPGTGYATSIIAPLANSVLALDASPEMLAILAARDLPRVTVGQQDLFAWTPDPDICDAVLAVHWVSHIPDARLPGFFGQLDVALRPHGRAVLVDVTADEIRHLEERTWRGGEEADGVSLATRRLDSGDSYSVVKEYREPDDFLRAAARHGWSGTHRTIGAEHGRGFVAYHLDRGRM
jgi:demethylmenaquinone methyltransferase/2-methoxy-6-polyprenyl-1,4-benzoquinol methylase